MCDNCNCKVNEPPCILAHCEYEGTDKECECGNCDKQCDCDCHTDYEPDGIDMAKENKYGYY